MLYRATGRSSCTVELPVGDRCRLVRGFSWTTSLNQACWFASEGWSLHDTGLHNPLVPSGGGRSPIQ